MLFSFPSGLANEVQTWAWYPQPHAGACGFFDGIGFEQNSTGFPLVPPKRHQGTLASNGSKMMFQTKDKSMDPGKLWKKQLNCQRGSLETQAKGFRTEVLPLHRKEVKRPTARRAVSVLPAGFVRAKYAV